MASSPLHREEWWVLLMSDELLFCLAGTPVSRELKRGSRVLGERMMWGAGQGRVDGQWG